MDLIIGLVVLGVVLLGVLLSSRLHSFPLFRWLTEKNFTFSQKVLIASLTGFAVYILITPRVSSVAQKGVVFLVILIFIAAVFIRISPHNSG